MRALLLASLLLLAAPAAAEDAPSLTGAGEGSAESTGTTPSPTSAETTAPTKTEAETKTEEAAKETARRAAKAARGEAEVTDPERASIKKGRVVVRGSASLDLNKSINIGGQNTGTTPLRGSVSAGVGYFVLTGLSLDLDLDLRFTLAPDPAIDSFGITPGLRYFPFPQFYVRGGVPIVLVPDFGLGALFGAGYRQPLGRRVYLIIGVDYTYWLTESFRRTAPGGRLDLHAGVQTHF